MEGAITVIGEIESPYTSTGSAYYDELLKHPDPDNPYLFGGVSLAPTILYRLIDTVDRVPVVLAEGKLVRAKTDEDILANCSVTADELETMLTTGSCRAPKLDEVLNFLGMKAVTIPSEIVFAQ